MQQELRNFIIDNFMFGMDDVQLSQNDSLVERGLIDSTGVLELIAFLEEKYSIEINDSELIPENLDSIDGLARFVGRKLDKKLAATP